MRASVSRLEHGAFGATGPSCRAVDRIDASQAGGRSRLLHLPDLLRFGLRWCGDWGLRRENYSCGEENQAQMPKLHGWQYSSAHPGSATRRYRPVSGGLAQSVPLHTPHHADHAGGEPALLVDDWGCRISTRTSRRSRSSIVASPLQWPASFIVKLNSVLFSEAYLSIGSAFSITLR